MSLFWSHIKVIAKCFHDLETDGVDRVKSSHWLLENVGNFLAAESAKSHGFGIEHLLIFNFYRSSHTGI